MTEKKTKQKNQFEGLKKFLLQNKRLDWNRTNLVNEQQLKMLNWKGLEKDQDTVLKEVKAYQRLVRILGEDNHKLIMAMLGQNIHSAIQIAAIPKLQFKQKYASCFNEDQALMDSVYKKALAIRGQLLLLYMNKLQKSESHAGQLKSLAGK